MKILERKAQAAAAQKRGMGRFKGLNKKIELDAQAIAEGVGTHLC